VTTEFQSELRVQIL